MSLGFSTALRNARLQTIIDYLDAGTVNPNGSVNFYGAGVGRPATGAAITDQTLVGTVGLSIPSATIAAGVLTFDTFADDTSADADADIGWARFFDRDGNFVFDAGCGIAASGEDIIFNTLTARIGGIIQILSGSITEGNA